MNVNAKVEDLGPCKKLMHVEVDAQSVDKALEEEIGQAAKQARLPGFRAGKVPRHMIKKVYGDQIEAEAKRKLISAAYREAVNQQELQPVGQPDIEEIQFSQGQPLEFAATIETAPQFELPEYKGIHVKVPIGQVTEDDVNRALNVLQQRQATFQDVDRSVQEGDYVVVDFKGQVEGKPVTDFAESAKGLAEQTGYWLKVDKDHFLPGFAEPLVGARAGEQRTVKVTFPADFVTPELAAKEADYDVTVQQVKEQVLPELNDEFAKSYGAETMDRLVEGVEQDLEHELNHKRATSLRNQLVQHLLDRVTCELPESLLKEETRSVIYQIVQENQQRGVSKETIEKEKDQIYSVANGRARDRVKSAFILGKIAQKEGIEVSQEELSNRIHQMAEQHQIPVKKLVQQLRDRNALGEIHEQILINKVLDFLELNANVEETFTENQPADDKGQPQ